MTEPTPAAHLRGAIALWLLLVVLTSAHIHAAWYPQQPDAQVIHIYVDGRNGSDALAAGSPSWNPDGANTVPIGTCQPLGLRPNDVRDATSQQPLRHAAHPFKTISAAVDYIWQIPARAGLAPGTPPLPYPPNPAPGDTVWSHAIIHVMPGLYAPYTDQHPGILLHGNGEEFPIHLPPRVSVRGTSGLNTVLEPVDVPAFVFGVYFDAVAGLPTPWVSASVVPVDGSDCTLSHLLLFGAKHVPSQQSSIEQKDQAAILVDCYVPSTPTITNCVLAKNRVGILVNAFHTTPPEELDGGPTPPAPVYHHGLSIVGNTFAWNGVGIWNGEWAGYPYTMLSVATGWSKLVLINNVFDASERNIVSSGENDYCIGASDPPDWPFSGADSAFEGIPQEDLTVAGAGDFNAYEYGTRSGIPFATRVKYNVTQPAHNRSLFRAVLPRVQIRPGTAQPTPDPARNIADITGWEASSAQFGLKPRGVLFIRDLFCFGRYDAVQGWGYAGFAVGGLGHTESQFPLGGFDGSPLDFRIAPTAARTEDDYVNYPPSPPGTPNPLVDNGFDFPLTGTVTMANGETVGRPGALDHPNWSFDAWRFDTEGFGNPREHDHPTYAGSRVTDIGADELSDLVVAGYRMGTTSFVRLEGDHPDNPDPNGYPIENRYLWYLGAANTAPTQMHAGHQAAGFPQPYYRYHQFPGFQVDWPAGYVGNEVAPTWHSVESGGTGGLTLARPWRFDPPAAPVPPLDLFTLYLATAADITPHLLPDPHPWWTWNPIVAPANTIPPALTLWQSCLGAGVYNAALYVPVTSAIASPPGAMDGYVDPLSGFDFLWLDGLQIPGWASQAPDFKQMNHWMNGGGGALVQQFDSWSRGGNEFTQPAIFRFDLPPTTVSGYPNHPIAIRFSIESSNQGFVSSDTNLQSFLVLVQGGSGL